MTSHELARKLLTMPDLPVIGRQVGQGSNEQQDEPLDDVILGSDDLGGTIELHFG